MTGVLATGGPPLTDRWRIELYDHTELSNCEDAPPDPGAIAQARAAFPLLFATVDSLQPPTGRYNCHGLVFAARRTNVPTVGLDAPGYVRDVLARDGYRPIADEPKVGDIAAYTMKEGGEIEHTGIMVRVDLALGSPVVFIWSAWGSLGEFEHRVDRTPYRNCSIGEYWRLWL